MEICKVANCLLNSSLEEFTASLTGTMLENEMETTQLLELKNGIELQKSSETGNTPFRRHNNYLLVFSENRHFNSLDMFINYETNLHNCSKTSPCPCCGECASWKRDHTTFVHSKKNCPYVYFYKNLMRLKFMDCDVKLQHKYIMTFNTIASKWIVDKYNTLSGIESQMNIKIEEAGKFVADKLNVEIKDLTTKYEETNKELQLFHRIMPQDTINQRREEYEMRKNEIETKENELSLKIKESEDALEKLKIESGLTEINVKMRNLKIKNMEVRHKKTIAEMDQNLSIMEEANAVLKTQTSQLHKQLNDAKRMSKIESEGFKDMEEMNEKMYKMLKEQKKCPDENCCYCLLPIVDECMTLKCGHHFHSSCYMKDCLTKCRENKYTRTYKCPLCRGEALVLDNY